MAQPEAKIARKNIDPKLSDLLNLLKKDIMLSLNCHAIGQINGFDSSTQMVSVQIQYKKTFLQKQPDGTYINVAKDYPVLLDVPVVILNGGPLALTFPIAVGDNCIILFNDRDIDNWVSSGQVLSPASTRLHSFSDGVALVGLNPMSDPWPGYDSTRAVLKDYDGGGMIGVGGALVKVANDDTTLLTLLQELINTIKAITTSNAVVGVPCTISATSQTALDGVATDLEGLLE